MSNTGNPVQPPANFPKQAVVVIHGMGEQTPMGTIKSFVDAVWTKDASISQNDMPQPNEVWSKPDDTTGSLELRRITTRQSTRSETFVNGARTDFFELYWADLNSGSTLATVENWLLGLVWRNPFRTIPRQLVPAWFILLILTAVIIGLALMPSDKLVSWILQTDDETSGGTKYLSELAPPLLAAAFAWLANKFLVQTFGRVVRYTRATPDNIAARKDIRERGLALLSALHAKDYKRIIVVGHSLGSILGYDLISYFWASRFAAYQFPRSSPDFAALVAIEKAVDALTKAQAGGLESPSTKATLERAKADFDAAQTELARLLRLRSAASDPKIDTRWLITDFITVGSPLTHCEFLLNAGRSDFEEHKRLRELPTSPPVQELLDTDDHKNRAKTAGFPLNDRGEAVAAMAFPFLREDAKGNEQEFWQLHHAAVFAAVRWTNIYDPNIAYVVGDVISGPLAIHYGQGVHDINLKKCRGKKFWLFTHTSYWKLRKGESTNAPVRQMRDALNLDGRRSI